MSDSDFPVLDSSKLVVSVREFNRLKRSVTSLLLLVLALTIGQLSALAWVVYRPAPKLPPLKLPAVATFDVVRANRVVCLSPDLSSGVQMGFMKDNAGAPFLGLTLSQSGLEVGRFCISEKGVGELSFASGFNVLTSQVGTSMRLSHGSSERGLALDAFGFGSVLRFLNSGHDSFLEIAGPLQLGKNVPGGVNTDVASIVFRGPDREILLVIQPKSPANGAGVVPAPR